MESGRNGETVGGETEERRGEGTARGVERRVKRLGAGKWVGECGGLGSGGKWKEKWGGEGERRGKWTEGRTE